MLANIYEAISGLYREQGRGYKMRMEESRKQWKLRHRKL
jgi:hypothetical protein